MNGLFKQLKRQSCCFDRFLGLSVVCPYTGHTHIIRIEKDNSGDEYNGEVYKIWTPYYSDESYTSHSSFDKFGLFYLPEDAIYIDEVTNVEYIQFHKSIQRIIRDDICRLYFETPLY